MRLLLDTHLLLWASVGGQSLSPAATAYMDDPANELWFSSMNIWEIAIKHGLGKESFYTEPRKMRERLLGAGYRELAFEGEHAIQVATLPPIHRDPFDRGLVAQAIAERMTLVTADATVARYPGAILKV